MPRPAIRASLSGGKQLERALGQLPKATSRSVLRQALIRSAKPVVQDAESRAPVGETGELAGSITAKTTLTSGQRAGRQKAAPVEVFIGSTAPKAHLLEFGTVNMPAQPFLRPAWDANKLGVRKSIGRELWAALSRAARRLAKQAETGKLSKASRRHFGV